MQGKPRALQEQRIPGSHQPENGWDCLGEQRRDTVQSHFLWLGHGTLAPKGLAYTAMSEPAPPPWLV